MPISFEDAKRLRIFKLLEFVVCSLDDSLVEDFVSRNCETDKARLAVKRHLDKLEVIMRIPLLLTFLCQLADISEEILTNRSLLYDRCLYHMLKREATQNKLAQKIDWTGGTSGNWREAAVVTSTADLAFYGRAMGKFVFGQADLQLHSVPNDAVVSGFLHQEVGFNQDCRNAQFPHLSVQEYLAALHCYQLAMRGEIPEKPEVIGQMSENYSPFMRFLLGIASTNGHFRKLVEGKFPGVGQFPGFLQLHSPFEHSDFLLTYLQELFGF